MIQAGVVPVTWQQVMLEWQRDWARKETYDAVVAIVREHSGAYGMGVDYAYTMVHKALQRAACGAGTRGRLETRGQACAFTSPPSARECWSASFIA
jgi:hypothetical protein